MGQNLTLMGITFSGGLNQNSDRNAVPELVGTDPRWHYTDIPMHISSIYCIYLGCMHVYLAEYIYIHV